MLSVIGLALDFVGAVVLVLGLYGHTRPTVPGMGVRSPTDVAHDAALGSVGALSLTSGFALQSLVYFGVSVECSRAATLTAALGTIALATVVAWALYGGSFLFVLRRERRDALAKWGED